MDWNKHIHLNLFTTISDHVVILFILFYLQSSCNLYNHCIYPTSYFTLSFLCAVYNSSYIFFHDNRWMTTTTSASHLRQPSNYWRLVIVTYVISCYVISSYGVMSCHVMNLSLNSFIFDHLNSLSLSLVFFIEQLCKLGTPPKMGKWGSLPMNGQVRTLPDITPS